MRIALLRSSRFDFEVFVNGATFFNSPFWDTFTEPIAFGALSYLVFGPIASGSGLLGVDFRVFREAFAETEGGKVMLGVSVHECEHRPSATTASFESGRSLFGTSPSVSTIRGGWVGVSSGAFDGDSSLHQFDTPVPAYRSSLWVILGVINLAGGDIHCAGGVRVFSPFAKD